MHRKLIRSIFTLLISCAVLSACSSSQKSTAGTTYTKTSKGSSVQVILDDYVIHMPTAFPGPQVTFHITNSGDHDHSFKIKGNGVEQELQSKLQEGHCLESKGLSNFEQLGLGICNSNKAPS